MKHSATDGLPPRLVFLDDVEQEYVIECFENTNGHVKVADQPIRLNDDGEIVTKTLYGNVVVKRIVGDDCV